MYSPKTLHHIDSVKTTLEHYATYILANYCYKAGCSSVLFYLILFTFTSFIPHILVSFQSSPILMAFVTTLKCPTNPFRLAHLIYLLLELIHGYP